MHIGDQPIKVKASSKLSVISQDDTSYIFEPVPDIKVRPKYRLLQICPDDTLTIFEPLPYSEPHLLYSDRLARNRICGLDVIKAIVYGGLLESIASLSIISSAAAGDATTRNIVALGLANVIGGLVVLFHNLRGLNSNPIEEQYEELLGNPQHFLFHAVIAIISYLVFGLMAPIVYGFSFQKSDDNNFKLITVAAASLICITILSIGKAYIRRSTPKQYIQTVIYYASVGVSVSGLGYVSGELISEALKKLNVFELRSPVNMSAFEAGVLDTALSSY